MRRKRKKAEVSAFPPTREGSATGPSHGISKNFTAPAGTATIVNDGEIKDSRGPKKALDWEFILKVIAAVVAVVTISFTIFKYIAEERGKAFNERRAVVYRELMKAAASFSEATSMEDAERARKEFREIYKGQFNEVKDDVVVHAADRFSQALKAWEDSHESPDDNFTPPRKFLYEDPNNGQLIRFGKLSVELSYACRTSLEKHR